MIQLLGSLPPIVGDHGGGLTPGSDPTTEATLRVNLSNKQTNIYKNKQTSLQTTSKYL